MWTVPRTDGQTDAGATTLYTPTFFCGHIKVMTMIKDKNIFNRERERESNRKKEKERERERERENDSIWINIYIGI